MTDPMRPEAAPAEATPAMRRKADLMVGLFVGAIVALLGGIVVLVTSGSAGLGIGLIVVAVLVGGGAVVLLRSISPEERALLAPPRPDVDTGTPSATESATESAIESATDDPAPEDPR